MVYTDKLTALATLAATGAFAQTTDGSNGFQITGNFNAGLVANKFGGNKVSGFEQNGMGTSSIFFRGTEDLGGGLKANFLHGTDIQFMTVAGDAGSMYSATNSGKVGTFGTDQKMVGLSGAFGAVNFGAINNSSLYNGIVLFNPTVGTSYGGGYGSIICADPSCGVVRYDNTLEYKSPVINGFQAFGQYATKQKNAINTNYTTTLGALNGPEMAEVSAKYSNGPLTAAYTHLGTDATGVATATTAAVKKSVDTFAAAYDLGNGLRLGALTQKLKAPTLVAYGGAEDLTKNTDRSTTAVNAIYTMGLNTFMLTVGQAKENNATRTTFGGKTSKFTGVQYKYALSKMTSLEARWEKLDDAAGTYTFPAQFTTTDRIRTRSTVGVNMNF